MRTENLQKELKNGSLDKTLISLYGKDSLASQKERYLKLASRFDSEIGAGDFNAFSTAGRTELMGNHTDHNHGCVLCGSVNLDTLAFATKTNDTTIKILSEGYPPAIIDFASTEFVESEKETTEALIRGIVARFKEMGFHVGGFSAVTTSNVPGGSGLSSSAACEVLIGTILSHFYNKGIITPVEIAKIGQWAENNYFCKPCGLMDQVACGYGGIVKIDFNNPAKPIISNVKFDFFKNGYTLMVVNTGGSHADLTSDYAAVPAEMKAVAKFFGKEVLRGITKEELLKNASEIRKSCGDRAFLRALHFINENDRPTLAVKYLAKKRIKNYLALVNDSGLSSWRYLQNCTAVSDLTHQGVTTALAISAEIAGSDGIFRVHGGGFAGTIQAYVKNSKAAAYKAEMEKHFGAGSVTTLLIRQVPTTMLF